MVQMLTEKLKSVKKEFGQVKTELQTVKSQNMQEQLAELMTEKAVMSEKL